MSWLGASKSSTESVMQSCQMYGTTMVLRIFLYFVEGKIRGKMVPFKIAINEWYISHLVSPKMGTHYSMAFEIYQKVAEEEMRYLEGR